MFERLLKLFMSLTALVLLTPVAISVMAAPPPQAGQDRVGLALMQDDLAADGREAGLAAGCAESYTVQAGDWLSKIAEKYFGDVLAYEAIFAATNEAAKIDARYGAIANPDIIEIGQVLCIPTQGGGEMAAGEIEAVLEPPSESAPPTATPAPAVTPTLAPPTATPVFAPATTPEPASAPAGETSIETPIGTFVITGVDLAERFPPDCDPSSPMCDQAKEGYQILAVWLDRADGGDPSEIGLDIFKHSEEVYAVAGDGSRMKRIGGGLMEGRLFVFFTPAASARDFTLYWPGNPAIELGR